MSHYSRITSNIRSAGKAGPGARHAAEKILDQEHRHPTTVLYAKHGEGRRVRSYMFPGIRGRSARQRGASQRPPQGGAAAPPSSPAACLRPLPLESTFLLPPPQTSPETACAAAAANGSASRLAREWRADWPLRPQIS
jgi:hypothetical protein